MNDYLVGVLWALALVVALIVISAGGLIGVGLVIIGLLAVIAVRLGRKATL